MTHASGADTAKLKVGKQQLEQAFKGLPIGFASASQTQANYEYLGVLPAMHDVHVDSTKLAGTSCHASISRLSLQQSCGSVGSGAAPDGMNAKLQAQVG